MKENLKTNHELNKFIIEKTGTNIFGKMFYRLVWSEDMMEIRLFLYPSPSGHHETKTKKNNQYV
jgi:hypothetical protein